jgi:hypothetical protein
MVALELALEVDGIRRSVKWPTFILGPKQVKESQPRIYFHRFGGFDDIRYEKTLERLKENDENRTCWMGTPGIGKCELLISFLSCSVLCFLSSATGVNFILFELVANLGAPDFPKVLFYRNPYHIVTFSLHPQSNEVVVEYDEVETLLDFSKVGILLKGKKVKNPGQCCLVLEMEEDERGPTMQINTFVTISSREAEDKLKSFSKSSARFLLVGPPTRKQIHFMEWERFRRRGAEAVWYLSNPSLAGDALEKLSNLSETQVSEKKAILSSLVSSMLDEVGPIPRAFSTQDEFDSRRWRVHDNMVGLAMLQATSLSIFNVPPALKFFMAPHPQTPPDPRLVCPPIDTNLRHYFYEFLTDKAEGYFAKAKITREQAAALEISGTNYMIAEARVAASLKTERLPGDQVADWEWCKDVGFNKALTSPPPMVRSSITVPIPPVKMTSTVHEAFLAVPVDELKEGSLYQSRVHNFRLGDMVLVDHNTKTCFFFQVTLKDLPDHPVKLSVLETVMNRLKIREKNYTLHLVFVTDFSLKHPHGSKFELEQTVEEEKNKGRGQGITLSSWKDQWKDQEGHLSHFVKSSIVRTKLTVGEESVLPPAKPDGNEHNEAMILVTGQDPSSVDLLLSTHENETVATVTKPKLQAALKALRLPHTGPACLPFPCLTLSTLFS